MNKGYENIMVALRRASRALRMIPTRLFPAGGRPALGNVGIGDSGTPASGRIDLDRRRRTTLMALLRTPFRGRSVARGRAGAREVPRPAVAVVTGLGVTGLAVARALGRRGIPVVGIAPGRPAFARSRYVRFLSGPSALAEEATLDYYLTLAPQLGRSAVLIPTGDADVLLIARYREALEKHFRFLVAETALLETITSKRRLVALAERLRLPLPRTVLATSRAELETAVDVLRFPCVIKPEFTQLWRSPAAFAAGIGEVKAIPIETAAELPAWYDRLAALDTRLIVQEMVVGPDENHIDYHALSAADGTITAEFVGRKIRLAPAHYGSGCYVESTHADEVLDLGRFVLKRLGYQGMMNMNFKRDARDGRLYLLELNPRFSTWTALDVACGVNFPFYYYQAARGAPYAAPPTYPAGVRWVNLLADIRAMRRYARDGTWSWRRWLRSVLGASVDAVFTGDDPGPAWATLFLLLRPRIRGKAIRWTPPPGLE